MSRSAGSRQDTYDLRDQILGDDHNSHAMHAHADAANHYGTDDEEHSVLEDDSDGDDIDDYADDDDGSSSLSIPNESIDFDLVYAFHSFAATVDGQANVVKGDSLFLMDDSNSYWWLVRVLKTQEVGYIPAENIETPFERLARLNKHRNVDLASATQAEMQAALNASQDRLRAKLAGNSPDPRGRKAKGVIFTPTLSVHRYPPAIWKAPEEGEEESEGEWIEEGYEDEDEDLAQEQMEARRAQEEQGQGMRNLEPDDGMKWDDHAVTPQQHQTQQPSIAIPSALLPGGIRDPQQQAALRAQQQHEFEQREEEIRQQHMQQQQAALQQRQQESARQQEATAETAATRQVDPLEAVETRKLTVTPTIAREDDRAPGQPYLPSAAQEEERAKRLREEEAEEARKKPKGKPMAAPVASPSQGRSAKLRKEKEKEDDSKKKKSSIFGNIFNRNKKDRKSDSASMNSVDSAENNGRSSEESSRPGARTSGGALSPTSNLALHQQTALRLSEPPSSAQPTPLTPERAPQVSPLANSLRQRDQAQQALYQQQYLNRSPSSPPEPNYALQPYSLQPSPSASSGLGPPVSRPRPGSLILTPANMEGAGVPELSVVRVFAGKNVQTEATFKTVLLNSHTSSADLVRQAIQRFRLPSGEDANDYYLTIKQVEGGASAVLRPHEQPLAVFENLVAESMELPKVKRSSVGSISSISSNLSLHPAITKLPMNDFSDDSAVKFYLNRRGEDGLEGSATGHEDETLIADTSHTESAESLASPNRSQFMQATGANVTPERFSSPSFRFALQLVIYPDDLPEDMVFHPTTEAIVFKNTLKDATSPTSAQISPHFRRKIHFFPKNVTVAEVIESGLERFGILEGVVDGGDEVEDKYTKRRSSNRVRYGLIIDSRDGRERELLPTSRVIDAFPRPPTMRMADRQAGTKRRSIDAMHLLGSLEDVNPEDPVFILRRAVSYRTSTSRHRNSAPLDEIALQHLHRESASITGSDYSTEGTAVKQPSRQEIIAAQRAATRANQRAILSAQTNEVRGVDVLLPGNAVLRSSRYDVNDRMRYSYVEPDGETYDISEIIEDEWRDASSPNRGDLLEGVIAKSDKLDRVLSKIKQEKGKEREIVVPVESRRSIARSISPSEYSEDGEGNSRAATPGSAGFVSRLPGGAARTGSRLGTTTPTQVSQNATLGDHRRKTSISHVLDEDAGGYSLPLEAQNKSSADQKRLVLPKDDFGISHMMALIDYKASLPKRQTPELHPVDQMLFGTPIDLNSLHPQVREIYGPAFKQLEEVDKMLDHYIRPHVNAF